MPPRRWSRHTFTTAYLDAAGDLILTEPVRYTYRELPDNRLHRVKVGDTLFNLASRSFKDFRRPAGLWWIIADFQPDPIHDPTIALTPGSTLVIPSTRTVLEEVFSEKRRAEH